MGRPALAAIKAQRETAWRNRLARFAASKLTVKAFCRREAVSVGTFYGWQARLRTRDADAPAVSRTALALSAVDAITSTGYRLRTCDLMGGFHLLVANHARI